MGLLTAIWNLYLGLFSLLGHTVLVIIGIGLCGYATAQQLNPVHDPHLDIALFASGLLLISFSMIRRIIWTYSGITAVWGSIVWFTAHAITEHDQSFAITPELIALTAVPPLLVTLFLEITRPAEINETELEISLSEQPDADA